MGLFQNDINIVGKPENNKTNGVNMKSLNRYGAIREKLYEHNTLIVKQLVVNKKTKQKSVLY